MSLEAYRRIIDHLPDAILLVSKEGIVLGANRRLDRLGIDTLELLGRPLAEIAAGSPERLIEYLGDCARTGEPVPGSIRLTRSDGTASAYRVDGNVLPAETEESEAVVMLRLVPKETSVSHFATLNRQIDELGKEIARRKQVEAELRAEQKRLEVTLGSIGDAVIATDVDGRIVLMNPIAESLCGWTQNDAIGKPLSEVFHIVNEKTRLVVESPVEKVIHTGQVVGLGNHTILIARDRRETAIDDSAAPIIDEQGVVSGVVLVFRDVSERRKAQELNERLAAIVESSDDIIVSKNFDGIITSWNRGAERILGYSAEEVIGRHVSILMPPEQAEDVTKILSLIRRGERIEHYETKRRAKDGTIIDVSITVSPIRDASGRILGASKIGRDIRMLKLLEVERREADLRKDEFLAMLAHELRNPLASINNAVQLFGRLETEDDLEWAKDVILRQIKHLARLIDDLLDVSRITRGKIELRKEFVNLSPVVGSAVEVVRSLIEERKHELNVSLAPGVLRLEADPVRLEQILVNLLTNAAKYTEAGGRIWLSASREDNDLVIKVRDTGVGIAAELLPRIFDLFTQEDRSIARSEGGSGIGLALVQKLTEMHGGSVTASSEGPGSGSEFTVRLPAAAESSARPRNPKPTFAALARPCARVLVVDDNVDTASGLVRLLKLLGHDVKLRMTVWRPSKSRRHTVLKSFCWT